MFHVVLRVTVRALPHPSPSEANVLFNLFKLTHTLGCRCWSESNDGRTRPTGVKLMPQPSGTSWTRTYGRASICRPAHEVQQVRKRKPTHRAHIRTSTRPPPDKRGGNIHGRGRTGQGGHRRGSCRQATASPDASTQIGGHEYQTPRTQINDRKKNKTGVHWRRRHRRESEVEGCRNSLPTGIATVHVTPHIIIALIFFLVLSPSFEVNLGTSSDSEAMVRMCAPDPTKGASTCYSLGGMGAP
jgi:hypothetical protein